MKNRKKSGSKPPPKDSISHLNDTDVVIGYHLHEGICTDFDAVDVEGFQTFVKYMDAQYHEVRNAKTTSGRHACISASVGGKPCLLHRDKRLEATGNHYLSNCPYGVEGSLHSGTIYGLTRLIAGTSFIANFQDSELGIEIQIKSIFLIFY